LEVFTVDKSLPNSSAPDTAPIFGLIGRTRQLLRSSWVVTGAGLTVGLLLGALVATSIVDIVLPLPPDNLLAPTLRLIALLLVVVPAGWAAFTGIIRPLFRWLSNVQMARRIESHIPRIHNRLVSCVDLANGTDAKQLSPAFYRRLVSEAIERIRDFEPRKIVDFASLRRAGLFAVSSAVAFTLALVVLSDRLPTTLRRIFQPFADIPPATGVVYNVAVTPGGLQVKRATGDDPGNAQVLRGEEILFTVNVAKGQPEKLRLEMRSPLVAKSIWHDLAKINDNTWKLTLSGKLPEGFEERFDYRIHGGGTWTRRYHVGMVDRPQIVSLHTVLHYPDYMAITEPRIGPPQTAEVTGPEASTVEVVVKAQGHVTEGQVQLLEYGQSTDAQDDRAERTWFEDKVPTGAKSEGTWVWDDKRHQRSTHSEPLAVGPHGHNFQNAQEGFPIQINENLFAQVYIPAEHPPEAIMLEWDDGSGGEGRWEHRAIWGTDKFPGYFGGGRHVVGALPPAGQWVRLEVPAAVLGLEGKSPRGMGFQLIGGQAYWGRAGALPPSLRVKESFAMIGSGDNDWSGKFPLHGTGLYRVQLRNELGYPNKTMKEAKFTALPDNPPQVVIERPGTDLVLSQPGRVPLVVAAYDDFGLKDVKLCWQKGDGPVFEEKFIRQYAKPQRSDTISAALDLAALKINVGEAIRYKVQVRDRNPKGQVVETPVYTVRIAVDNNAADKKLADFEKTQDPFRQKLIDLIAKQAKVNATLKEATQKYDPLVQKVDKIKREQAIKDAKIEVKPAPQGQPNVKDPPPAPKDLKVDPETAKMLDALQKELDALGKQEKGNVDLAESLSKDLALSAEQAKNLELLQRPVGEQMSAMQKMFDQMAVRQMQELTKQLNEAAAMATKQGLTPQQMKEMEQVANRLQKELEAMKDRMDALSDARKNLATNPEDALDKLKNELMKQNSELTARDLADLKDFLARLREEMKQQEGNQEKLKKEGRDKSDKELPLLERAQEELEREIDQLFGAQRAMELKEKMKRMKRKKGPIFPERPYDPDSDEKMERPREQDSDEPLPKQDDDPARRDDAAANNRGKMEDKKDDEDDDKKFMPQLGGPKPKADPRFADRQRPVDRQPKDDAERRLQLENRQDRELDALDRAMKSLQSDEDALSNMLRKMQESMQGKQGNKQGDKEGQESEAMKQLAEMMNSPEMQQAMQMAAQARQARANRGQKGQGQAQNQPRQPQPNESAQGNLQGGHYEGQLESQLGQLDLNTRTVILKMPPRMREELLQSMREEGPEGYRRFIQDYFKRLTQVKAPGK
jgi:hypothetical protein